MTSVKDVTSFFKTPGGSLKGREKNSFDQIKSIVEQCTNELMIRPDYDAILQCVDLCNAEQDPKVLAEVVFLLKRKLGSSSNKVISLTLALAEALVKNGTVRIHAAFATDFFMKEMAKVARKFNGKNGADNREVFTQVLDIIQTWGEGFLSRQNQFRPFVQTYFELRKEGLPFNLQFDATNLPNFAPASNPNPGAPGSSQYAEDEILAAALAASLNVDEDDYFTERISQSDRPSNVAGGSIGGTYGGNTGNEAVDSLASSIMLLKDIILASNSANELKNDEIAMSVVPSIKSSQSRMMAVIEDAAINHPEKIDSLFKLNEDAQLLINIFDGVITGTQSLPIAKTSLSSIGITTQSQPMTNNPVQNNTSGNLVDLDFFDAPTTSQPQSKSSSLAPTLVPAPYEVSKSDSVKPRTQKPKIDEPVDAHIDFAHALYDKSEERASEITATKRTSSPSKVLLPPPPQSTNTTTKRTSQKSQDLLGDSDPFGPPIKDPFGSSTGDPFGPSGDPFGPITTSSSDPFGSTPLAPAAVSKQTDPFGPTPTAKPIDPFGPTQSDPFGPSLTSKPDPFGPSSSDPFGVQPPPISQPQSNPHLNPPVSQYQPQQNQWPNQSSIQMHPVGMMQQQQPLAFGQQQNQTFSTAQNPFAPVPVASYPPQQPMYGQPRPTTTSQQPSSNPFDIY